MRKIYKQRTIKNEKEKQKPDLIIEARINFEKEIHIPRSKSPKNINIMNKLDILNKFNKIFEKEKERKRDNSAKNRFNLRTISRNKYNKNIILKEIKPKGDYINSKLKIIRHSSYSKFDNEESIIKNNINDKEKEEITKIYYRDKRRKEEEKDNISNYNEKKLKRNISTISTINYNKKQPEKIIKNNINKRNKNKNNSNENNKEVNILQMPNLEHFDKPKNNIQERKIENKIINEKNQEESLNISPTNLLIKKNKFKNDDILLKNDELNIIYDNHKKSSFVDKNALITQSRQSFKYLVHQAYKNRNLSNSFNKYYESSKRKREGNKIKNNKQEIFIENKNNNKSKNKFIGLIKLSKNRSVANLKKFKDINEENKNVLGNNININTIKIKNNNINNSISSENHYIIKKIIINNNNSNYNKNKNKFNNIINDNIKDKINDNFNNINNKIINDDSIQNNKNICIKNYILINNLKFVNNKNINNNENNNKSENEVYNKDSNISYTFFNESQSNILNNHNYNKDLEILYNLGEKMRIIINRINNFQECQNECYKYIEYYFNNKIYNKFDNYFFNENNKYNISCYIKKELICLYLCYDISFTSYFNQTLLLLKAILNIFHLNYHILIYYIINLIKKNFNISELMKKIIILLDNDSSINQLKNEEINEYYVTSIIINNLNNINNYYKMIIDNIYGKYNIIKDENFKFPKCNNNYELIKTKINQYNIINIVSSFFYDAYITINNYDFLDLKKFYYLFLNKNYNNQIIINNRNIYYLPKIKNCYKYSLVLDLDETLISFKKNATHSNLNKFINNLNTTIIIRPGLIEFLKNMKQFYELILFSSGTSDYVDPIIKLIEKNENFFEFVLYRQHISFNEIGEYFKNLNLLNRNIKNILIIDDMEQNFKYHKANGICIKPFYGDYEKDINILKILGQILIKIRMDADESGDIRISLNKQKKDAIYSKVATNLNYS